MKRLLILLCFIIFSTGFSNTSEDVVYLKNGSIIRGSIIEQIPNKSIKVQTNDGSIFVYDTVSIEKILKENPFINSAITSPQIEKMMLLNRQNNDVLLLGASYGLTLVGSLVMGVNNMASLLVPVAGPFLQMLVVSGTDYPAKNRDYILLLASGLVQGYCVYDFIKAGEKINNIDNISLSMCPYDAGVRLTVACNF